MIKLHEKKSSFPPYEYLMQVLMHCPQAAFTYMQLWKDKNREDKVVIYKDEIWSEYLVSKIKLKSDLQKLAREALINIEERPNTFEIELTNWSEEAFEQTA
jgi:hypothetical protein